MTDTIRVTFDRDVGDELGGGRTRQTVELPSWCSGSPLSGAAMYLFGYPEARDEWSFELVEVEDVEPNPDDVNHPDYDSYTGPTFREDES